MPTGNFVDPRLKEIALHEWDIRSVLEPDPSLTVNSLDSIVILMNESFASGSIRWAFWSGPALGKSVRHALAKYSS